MTQIEDLPIATVERSSRIGLVTFVPFVVALLVAALVWSAWSERGTALLLRASEGHGLAVGDAIVYRGARVGEVREIELAPSLDELFVHARLRREANGLAREGSLFWVERPRLSLDGIQGLDTILGGRRIGVRPGAPDAKRRTDFVMLAEPPNPEPDAPGGLEFFLEARERHGLVAGAPLLYRGVEVGQVLEVDLTPDATLVEIRAWVDPRYRELVRERTRFHEVGGIEFNAGLFGGLQVDLTSLRTLLVGGIALALANEPGPIAAPGTRFVLHPKPDPKFADARPALALGTRDDVPMPKLLRAERTWRQGLFRRKQTRRGWLFPTATGVVGPADILITPEDARDPTLEIDSQVATPVDVLWIADGLAEITLATPPEAPWPVPSQPPSATPGACLLIGPPDRPPVAVDAASLLPLTERHALDVPVLWDDRWHGACVLRLSDSRVLALCLVEDGIGEVVPFWRRN
ncbi:MAG: MlaD family protein [Planctomycetota bacterium]